MSTSSAMLGGVEGKSFGSKGYKVRNGIGFIIVGTALRRRVERKF